MADKLWGELPPVEGTSQITRSMLALRTPKPYMVRDDDSGSAAVQDQLHNKHMIKYAQCPYIKHLIQLLAYIRQVNQQIEAGNWSKLRQLNVPKLPVFETPSHLRPELNSSSNRNEVSCESGTTREISEESAGAMIRQSVSTLAAAYGFTVTSSSTVNLLSDVVKQYIEHLAKTLRNVVDNEALTGITGFYDVVDQMLHDVNVDGMQGLCDFYEEKVIKYHEYVVNKAKTVSEQLDASMSARSSSSNVHEDSAVATGGWVRIQPARGESVTEAICSNERLPVVKTEPQADGSLQRMHATAADRKQAYVNTFRPISPSRDDQGVRPNKKKARVSHMYNY